MKKLVEILNIISVVSLVLAIIGIVVYYSVEIVSSFLVSGINMIGIGSVLWTVIAVFMAIFTCTFVLSCFIEKR